MFPIVSTVSRVCRREDLVTGTIGSDFVLLRRTLSVKVLFPVDTGSISGDTEEEDTDDGDIIDCRRLER